MTYVPHVFVQYTTQEYQEVQATLVVQFPIDAVLNVYFLFSADCVERLAAVAAVDDVVALAFAFAFDIDLVVAAAVVVVVVAAAVAVVHSSDGDLYVQHNL